MIRGMVSTLLSGILFCGAAPAAFAQSCLEAVDKEMELIPREFGAPEVQWSATVVNHCEEPRSVRASVQFLDADDKTAYETPEQFDLSGGASTELGRSLYVPSRLADILVGVRLDLESNTLPY